MSASPETRIAGGAKPADARESPAVRPPFLRYAVAAVAVACALAVKLSLRPFVDDASPFLIFFAAVIAAAWYGGAGAGLAAVLLATLVSDYFFLEPVGVMLPAAPGKLLHLLLFAAEGAGLALAFGNLRGALRRSESSEAAQREAARSLDESAGRLRDALKRLDFHVRHSPLAVIEWDDQFRVARWSDGAERLFGWRAEEIVGRRYEDWRFVHEDDVPAVQQVNRQLLTPGVQLGISRNRNYAKDGRVLNCEWYNSALLDDAGRLVSVLSLVLDTTARDTALAESRARDERYRAFVAQSTEGIWRFEVTQPIDTRLSVAEQIELVFEHSYLAECNDLMARMYGYERADEIIGARVSDLMARNDRNIAYLEAFIRSGYRLTDAETVETMRDGETRYFSNNLIGVLEPDGTMRRAWGTQRDITEARRAEEERARLLEREQQARREAEDSNRMKDEFLATLSHELRTPLTPIIGWTHLLRRGPLPAAEVGRGLSVINKNAVALSRLISDLLDMSAIMSGKLRIDRAPVDLDDVLREAAETARALAEPRGIRIELEAPDDAGANAVVEGDRTRLVQIFWNLLSNAVKFSDDGGRVLVRRERGGSGRVLVHVEDEGAGITPDFLPHVFSRFRQADQSSTRAYGGLGLGLALVKSFTRAHGGVVTAASAGANRGSRFTVELPCRPSPAAAAAATDTAGERFDPEDTTGEMRRDADRLDASKANADADQPRILIAEDSPDTLEMLCAVFRRAGYRVTACADAHEALRAAEAEEFDLLVADIGMPGMNGYRLLGELEKRARRTGAELFPAIVLTGYASERDAAAALAAGFRRHIPKPVDPRELLAAVRELLAPADAATPV